MNKKFFSLLLLAFFLTCLKTIAQDNLHMTKLQSEMLRLMSTDDRDRFMEKSLPVNYTLSPNHLCRLQLASEACPQRRPDQ
jgi:hypothetical protein